MLCSRANLCCTKKGLLAYPHNTESVQTVSKRVSIKILQSLVLINVMDRLGRGVRWVYFEKIDIRCIRNHYAALISSMIAKWLNSYFEACYSQGNGLR